MLCFWGCGQKEESHATSHGDSSEVGNKKSNYIAQNTSLYDKICNHISSNGCNGYEVYSFEKSEQKKLVRNFIDNIIELDTIFIANDTVFYSKQFLHDSKYGNHTPKNNENCIVKLSPIIYTKDSTYLAVYIQKINPQKLVENEMRIFYYDNDKLKVAGFTEGLIW